MTFIAELSIACRFRRRRRSPALPLSDIAKTEFCCRQGSLCLIRIHVMTSAFRGYCRRLMTIWSPATPVRPRSWLCGWLNKIGEGGSEYDRDRLGRLDHPRGAAFESRAARAE